MPSASGVIPACIALNPYYPSWFHFIFFYDHYRKGEFEPALAEAQKINMPRYFWNQAVLAMVYGRLGRVSEAEAATKSLLELYPDFPTNVHREAGKWFDEDLVAQIVTGLRKAGLDIPDAPAD